MRYKLLSVSKWHIKTNNPFGINIGDYIQALAASQFYPYVDGFIDRDEELKSYDGEECKVIMNGWYAHNSSEWPPSNKIHPLFVAFHLNSSIEKQFLSDESIGYLKQYSPIGCRDYHTLDALKRKGIETYFSGCLTLTLGKRYKKTKRGGVYFVDPICEEPLDLRMAVMSLMRSPLNVLKLSLKKNLIFKKGRIRNLLRVAMFYQKYTRVFSPSLLMTATYITQQSRYYQETLASEEERMKEAERLVDLYAGAEFVITSRIHCALPCLGLETPVVFLLRKNDTDASSCRFGGLTELLNAISINGKGELSPLFGAKFPITLDNKPRNGEKWRTLAERLNTICTNFIKEGL